jgi:hypothetical protein
MSFNVINGELYVLGDSFFSGSITGSSNISASGNLLINNIIVNDITGSGDLNISGSIYLQTTPTTGTSGDFLIYNPTTKEVETRVGGADGTSGTSGATGSSGTSGTAGENGSSGTSGADGSSGTSGVSGSSGTSGSSGSSGTSGVATINNDVDTRLLTATGTSGVVNAESDLTYEGNKLNLL